MATNILKCFIIFLLAPPTFAKIPEISNSQMPNLRAPSQTKEPTIDLLFLRRSIQGLVSKCLLDLKDINIDLQEMNDPGSFFDTRLAADVLIRSAQNRTYVVRYNPQIFAHPPSAQAVVSILAHELNHIRDYTQMPIWELGSFVIAYLTDKDFQRDYERLTDLKALAIGFAPGLIEYREWLYKHVSSQELEIKKRNYWTPDEIKHWQSTHAPQQSCYFEP